MEYRVLNFLKGGNFLLSFVKESGKYNTPNGTKCPWAPLDVRDLKAIMALDHPKHQTALFHCSAMK